MSDLDNRLRRADAKAKAEHIAKTKAERANGGPVDGGPDDRWIAYHATIRSRSMVVWAFAGSAAILLGIGVFFLTVKPDWRVFGLVAGASLVPAVALIAYHLVRRAKAIGEQRAYVASLPFELAGYLDTMRQPRWWAASSYAVMYRPEIDVTWTKEVDANVVEKLCTLADATFRAKGASGTFAPTYTTKTDPWRWARGVVAEVLVPLSERAPVARAELRVVFGVEATSAR